MPFRQGTFIKGIVINSMPIRHGKVIKGIFINSKSISFIWLGITHSI